MTWRPLKVLIMGEYSGNTRRAFRALGHDAWSCDFLPSEDNSPYHLQCDVMLVINDGWDLMIAHPDCTYLTSAAEWCYKDDPGKNMSPGVLYGAERREAREEAVEFFLKLWRAKNIKARMLENPVGVMSKRLRKPNQIIQPYEYGHDASKKTCLWLDSLSLLRPTQYIKPRLVCKVCKGRNSYDAAFEWGCSHCYAEPSMLLPRWANQTDSNQNVLGPNEDRWKDRSRTYPGWSWAWAIQWGGIRMNGINYKDSKRLIADFDYELEGVEL